MEAGIYDSQVLSGIRNAVDPSYTGIALSTLLRSRVLAVEGTTGGMRRWVEHFYQIWMGLNVMRGLAPELREDGGKVVSRYGQ